MVFGLTKPSVLRRAGIVGMNRRNVSYIARYNPRVLYPTVDNKLKTKQLIAAAGLASPTLLGVARTPHHLQELAAFLEPFERFVVKPAQGSGGKGILVISARDGEYFVKSSGERITLDAIKHDVANIISGLYSLGGKPDVALIEDCIQYTDDFEGFSFQGVPDIRVILFKGYPVMAMTRLSTRESDGKANLHQGAVGVGIDIATGFALLGVQHAKPVTSHPDTGKVLRTLSIPHWHDLLYLASQCFEMTGLGYLGVDIVIDKHRGPLLLELNARPGLSIQLANGMGLQPRLDTIARETRTRNARARVDFVVEQFAEKTTSRK